MIGFAQSIFLRQGRASAIYVVVGSLMLAHFITPAAFAQNAPRLEQLLGDIEKAKAGSTFVCTVHSGQFVEPIISDLLQTDYRKLLNTYLTRSESAIVFVADAQLRTIKFHSSDNIFADRNACIPFSNARLNLINKGQYFDVTVEEKSASGGFEIRK